MPMPRDFNEKNGPFVEPISKEGVNIPQQVGKSYFVTDNQYKYEVKKCEQTRKNKEMKFDFNDILQDYENENKRYELIIKDIQT